MRPTAALSKIDKTLFSSSRLSSTLPLILFGLLVAHTSYAEEVTINKGFYRTSFETLSLSENEEMGIVGASYLLSSDMGFYYGVGVYGSVSGDRGGFFTTGLELGYEHALYKNISFDIGLYGGGGGSGKAPMVKGLVLRPHAGLLYDASFWRLGVAYSMVTFPSVDISSDQIALQLEIPFETVSANTKDSDSLYRSLQQYTGEYEFGWSDHYIAAIFHKYFPLGDTKGTESGQSLEDVSLVGFEYGSYFNRAWFGFIETSGAVKDGAGGYAEILGGVGYDLSLYKNLGVKAKLSLGSGGGGEIDTGGGFIYKADAMLYYKPVKQLTVNIGGGYIDAPQGSFSAKTATVSLAYNMTFLETDGNTQYLDTDHDLTTGEWNIRVANQCYLYSETISYTEQDTAVQLFGLKIDRYINENFYLSGQAYSTYSGSINGYASGLVGIGYRTPRFFEKLSLYFEMLGGAGASGNADTEGGAIVQPMAGLEYAFNNTIGMQLGAGRIKSIQGRLNTTVVDIGLVYKFGTIEKK